MKVVPKIAKVLELFAENETLSFGEVVEYSQLNRSTVAHILSALCQCQWLEKTSFGCYRMGAGFYALTGEKRKNKLLAMLAERAARTVAGQLKELGVICCFSQASRITLAKVAPESMVQLSINDRWFENSGWYRQSSGRLLLAMQSESQINAIVDKIGLPTADAWPEAVTWSGFQREIERIRSAREAVVYRENGFLTSLAVSVKDASNKDDLCVSTVYVTGKQCFSETDMLARLREIALDMEIQLSFHQLSVNS